MLDEQESKKIKFGKKEYTPKQLKKYSNWFYFLGVFITFISFFIMPVGIIFLILGIISLIEGYTCASLIKQQNKPTAQKDDLNKKDNTIINKIESPTKSVNTEKEALKNYCLFEDIDEDTNGKKQFLCYEYENDICMINYDINDLSGNGGEDIKFVQEPENQYDNKAVAIYLHETRIGYVYKGKIQDMINDWIRKNLFFKGYVNKINIDENKSTYKIAFYKPLDSFESKTFSLIKTKKKIDEFSKRNDNLECCDKGENIQLEYNDGVFDDKETLTVYNDCYEEIGELGSGAIKYYKEYADNEIVGIIDELFYDDNDNIKAKIKLFVTKSLLTN